MTQDFDVLIIGGGAIGLAIQKRFSEEGFSTLLVERNHHLGEETSSRNSEVIHAGLYFDSLPLKQRLCIQGKEALYRYCQNNNIAFHRVGKLIVGQQHHQNNLESIYRHADNLGVPIKQLRKTELAKLEPSVQADVALFSPSTGIIDSHQLIQSLAYKSEQRQGLIVKQTQVSKIHYDGHLYHCLGKSDSQAFKVSCKYLINAAGLSSTEVMKSIEGYPALKIPSLYYCKGHYFRFKSASPVKHLIYPLPTSSGLGIHATIDISGQLKFGPDTLYTENIDYSMPNEPPVGFLAAVKEYLPNVQGTDLIPDYSGIRPKLQGEGESPKDFIIREESTEGFAGLVNLVGIESPGLTACLSIADFVFNLLEHKG